MYDPQLQSRTAATSLVVRLKAGEERNHAGGGRGHSDPGEAARPARAGERHHDPRTVVDKERAPWRFSAWVFALFAALAFALSMLGLFSLVSLDVVNRRREFAIRMAVGATPRDIVGGVFRSAGTRAAIGIGLGLAVAVIATRGLQGLLFGVALTDG